MEYMQSLIRVKLDQKWPRSQALTELPSCAVRLIGRGPLNHNASDRKLGEGGPGIANIRCM